MRDFIRKIKRRETPFYDRLYRILKAGLTMSLPSWKPIHLPLYHLHVFTRTLVNKAYQGLWAVPAFKARCANAGSGIKLPNGMPLIMGPLVLNVGDDTAILDSTLAANGQVHPRPTLQIGQRTTVGYHSDISVANKVVIGNDVLIAKDCFIADNDGHPTDPTRRSNHESVNADEIDPVYIGDNVWIGTGCCVLKGAHISENSIIAANSVVTGFIPPHVLAGGTPAKVIKVLY